MGARGARRNPTTKMMKMMTTTMMTADGNGGAFVYRTTKSERMMEGWQSVYIKFRYGSFVGAELAVSRGGSLP